MPSLLKPSKGGLCYFVIIPLMAYGISINVAGSPRSDSDSLKNVIETGTAKEKLEAYIILFNHYYDNSNDSALHLAHQYVVLAEEEGEPIDLVISLEALALAYDFFQSDYSEAFKYYERALKICEENGLDYGMYILHGIGVLFHLSDDYSKALNYYSESLEQSKSRGDKGFTKKLMVNMASIQSSLANFEEAEKLFLEAINMGQSNDPFLEASNLSGLANLYIRKDQPAKAIPYLLQAIEINKVNKIDGETLYEYSYLIDAKIEADQLEGLDTLLLTVVSHINDRTQLRNRLIVTGSIYEAYKALGQFEKASFFSG